MQVDTIDFVYGGKAYECDANVAYGTNHVRLPDGKFLWIRGWREYYPPQPGDIVEVESAVDYAQASELVTGIEVVQGRPFTEYETALIAKFMETATQFIEAVQAGKVQLLKSVLKGDVLYMATTDGAYVVISPAKNILGIASSLEAEVVNAYRMSDVPKLRLALLQLMQED